MVLASFWFEVVSQNVCRILREEEERIREIDIDDQFGLNALSLSLFFLSCSSMGIQKMNGALKIS